MKNVNEVSREHINQLNRYLSEQFGRFGIILTRNPLKKNIMLQKMLRKISRGSTEKDGIISATILEKNGNP